MSLQNDNFGNIEGQYLWNVDENRYTAPCLGIVSYSISGNPCIVTLEGIASSSGGYRLRARKLSDGTSVFNVTFQTTPTEHQVHSVDDPGWLTIMIGANLRYVEEHDRLLISFQSTDDNNYNDRIYTHNSLTGAYIGSASIGVPVRYGWADSLGADKTVIAKTWSITGIDTNIKAWDWNPLTGGISSKWTKTFSSYALQANVLDYYGFKYRVYYYTDEVYDEELEEYVEVEVFDYIASQPYKPQIACPYNAVSDTIQFVVSSYDADNKAHTSALIALNLEDGSEAWREETTYTPEVVVDARAKTAAKSEFLAIRTKANQTQQHPLNIYEGGSELYPGFTSLFGIVWPPYPSSNLWLPNDCDFKNFHEITDADGYNSVADHKMWYLSFAGAQQEDRAGATGWEIRQLPASTAIGNPQGSDLGNVASQAAMLALSSAMPNDYCYRTDLSKRFTLEDDDYSVLASWVATGDGSFDRTASSTPLLGLPSATVEDPDFGTEAIRHQPQEHALGTYPDLDVAEDAGSEILAHHSGCMCIDDDGNTYRVEARISLLKTWNGKLYRGRRLNSVRNRGIDDCIYGRTGSAVSYFGEFKVDPAPTYTCNLGNGSAGPPLPNATYPSTPYEWSYVNPTATGETIFYDTIADMLAANHGFTDTHFVHAIVMNSNVRYELGTNLPTAGGTFVGNYRYPVYHCVWVTDTFEGAGDGHWTIEDRSHQPPFTASTPTGRWAYDPVNFTPVALTGPLATAEPSGSQTLDVYDGANPGAYFNSPYANNWKMLMPGGGTPDSVDYVVLAEPTLVTLWTTYLKKIDISGAVLWETSLADTTTNTFGTEVPVSGVVRAVIPTVTGEIFVVKHDGSATNEISFSSFLTVEYRKKSDGSLVWTTTVSAGSDYMQCVANETAHPEQPWLLMVSGLNTYAINYDGTYKTLGSATADKPKSGYPFLIINGNILYTNNYSSLSHRTRKIYDDGV